MHDSSAARAELVRARNLQPQNPVTSLNLGLFDFHHRRIALALPEFQRALDLDLTLDTTRTTAISGVLQSQAILAGKQQPPANASYCLPPV
jgi:hypothetical protein